MSLIQAFHQEKEQSEAFTQHNRQYLKENLRKIRTSVMFNRSFEILGNVSVALVVWIGGLAVLGQELTSGFCMRSSRIFGSFSNRSTTLRSNGIRSRRPLYPSNVCGESSRYSRKCASRSTMLCRSWSPMKCKEGSNSIRFGFLIRTTRRCCMGWIACEAWEFIGMVGTTGAGKSSLVNLLARFYDVKRGALRSMASIFGLPGESLHRLVGLGAARALSYTRARSSTMCGCSTRRLAAKTWRPPAIRRSAQMDPAAEEATIRSFPRGAADCRRVSGGFCPSHEFVYQPRILILDEATANLDSHTEQLIQVPCKSYPKAGRRS